VVFTGRRPKEDIPVILAGSDSCLVHLKKSELFKTVLPSKFFEAAAMAKPVIMGVEGHAAELVRRAGAGVCIESENPSELVQALIYLADHPEEAAGLGRSGRDYVTRHHDRDILASDYLRIVEKVAQASVAAGGN
jgi:glycosyltransferase involved in cell wall biosynthesis